MVMQLYGYFRSSAAFRVRIALNLKKLDYQNVAVHLRRNDQTKPDYLALNPQGLVPALEIDGQTLIQSFPRPSSIARAIHRRTPARRSARPHRRAIHRKNP